jgi:hypothetical protein
VLLDFKKNRRLCSQNESDLSNVEHELEHEIIVGVERGDIYRLGSELIGCVVAAVRGKIIEANII